MTTTSGNISTTLTLDVSKFSPALEKAVVGLSDLGKDLQNASKVANNFEKNIEGFGKSVTGAAQQFKSLEQTINSFAEKLTSAAEKFDEVSAGTRGVKKASDELNSSLSPLKQSLSGAAKESDTYRNAMSALDSEIKKASRGYLELAHSTDAASNSAKRGSESSVKDRLVTLEAERKTNSKIIAERRALVKELVAVESKLATSSNFASQDANRFFGKNAAKGAPARAEAAAYAAEAEAVKAQATHIESLVREIKWKNSEISKSIELAKEEMRITAERSNVANEAMMRERRAEAEDAALDKALAEQEKKRSEEAVRQKREELRASREADAEKVRSARKAAKEQEIILKEAKEYFAQMNRETSAQEREEAKARIDEARAESLAKREIAKQTAVANAAAEKQRRADERATATAATAAYREDKLKAQQLHNEKVMLYRQETRAKAEQAKEQAAIARAAAESERAQIKQTSDMLKGMAQLWAASKITHGMGASVDSADKFQREELVLKGLNLPKDQIDYVTQKAWDDSKVLKFVSALDMVKGRLAMMGGMPNVSQATINELLPQAAKAAHNIQTVTGDKSPEGFENMIRNISGVIEARGQTKDSSAAKNTIDLVQKIVMGTGRKIDIADLETFLRRDNLGANTMSDKGIAKMVAFMDEAKVSGHGGGGAASGVSTVGTAVKMFQKMMNGGRMTAEAQDEFAGAGLIDPTNAGGKTGKEGRKALAMGGLKVAQLSNADPVEAMKQVANAAYKYMSRPENIEKYFGSKSADTSDEELRRNAMRKFSTITGWSVTAQSMLTTAGDSDKMARADAQASKILSSKTADGMDKDVMKSYSGSVDSFNASMTNLKTSLGASILPLLTKFFEVVSKVGDALGSMFEGHPVAAQATMMAGAITAVTLTLRGFFGIAVTLPQILRSLAVANTAVATSATTAAVGETAMTRTSLSAAMGLRAQASAATIAAGGTATVAATTTAAAVAQGGMTVATGVLSRAMMLLGGPIGLITTALGIGLLAWSNWGNAAEEAAQKAEDAVGRAERAAAGMSTVKDKTETEKRIAEAKELREKGSKEVERAGKGVLEGGLLNFKVEGQKKIDEADRILKTETATLALQERSLEMQERKNALMQKNNEELAKENKRIDEVSKKESVQFKIDQTAHQEKLKNKKGYKESSEGKKEEKRLTEFKTTKDKIDAAKEKIKHSEVDTSGGFKIADDLKKKPREFEDGLIKFASIATGKNEVSQLKLQSLATGADTYEKRAEANFKAQLLAGNMDDGGDPRNRRLRKGHYEKKGGKEVWKNDREYDKNNPLGEEDVDLNSQKRIKIGGKWTTEGAVAQKAMAAYAQQQQAVDIAKGLKSAGELSAASKVSAAESSTFLASGGKDHRDAALVALERDLARREKDAPGLDKNADYLREKGEALSNQTLASAQLRLGKMLTDQKKPEEWDGSSVLSKESKAVKKFEEDTKEAVDLTKKHIEELKRLGADTTMLKDNLKKYEENAEKQKAQMQKTALDHQVVTWKNSMDEINGLKAKWGSAMMTDLERMVQGRNANGTRMTGRQMGTMARGTLAGMATDTSNMLLHRATGDLVGGAANMIGGGVSKIFGLDQTSGLGALLSGNKGPSKPDGTAQNPLVTVQGVSPAATIANAATAPAGMLAQALDKAKTTVGGFLSSIFGAKTATDGMAKSAVDVAVKGASEVAGMTTRMSAEQAATLSLTNLAAAATSAAASIAASGGGGGGGGGGLLGGLMGGGTGAASAGAASAGGSIMGPMGIDGLISTIPFANGGIMTNFGQVELKKYATGGIANSPQLAMFGEAGPEAYVPLPDGRSIPVTMKGAASATSSSKQGGQAINISIIVNQAAGGDATATSSQPAGNTATKMNNLAANISALVRQEMVSQLRPGGLLYK